MIINALSLQLIKLNFALLLNLVGKVKLILPTVDTKLYAISEKYKNTSCLGLIA